MRKVFNAETDRILTEGYPAGIDSEILLAEVNAARIPGGPDVTLKGLLHRVHVLKLARPAWFRSDVKREARLRHIAVKAAGEWIPKYRPRDSVRVHVTRQDHMQEPLTSVAGLSAARDGGVSTALIALLDDIRASGGPCPATRETAQAWGRANGCTRHADLGEINAARRKLKLPAFAVNWRTQTYA